MCPRHHNYMCGAGFSHHFSFKVTSIHCLKISYERYMRKSLMQFFYAI